MFIPALDLASFIVKRKAEKMNFSRIALITLTIFHLLPEAMMSPLRVDDDDDDHLQQKRDIHGSAVTREIEEMLTKHSYELSLRPSKEANTTRVGVDMLIESITDISEKNMDVTFTFGLHETWNDPRLKLSAIANGTSVVLPSRLIRQIWVPDIYVVGSKHSFIHTTSVDNVVIRLFSDGTIFYNLRITTTVACQMNLYNFPLDRENCSLVFQSLGYDSEEISLFWLTPRDDYMHIFLDEKLVRNMPKFQLNNFVLHKTDVPFKEMHTHSGAKRSRLQITFELNRYLLAVFFQSYFPAIATVILAGLGMWLDPKSAPARIALGVTSVLTISTIISGLKTSLPKVSYLTALDLYLWTCFLFVFSTVIEFCVLNYRNRMRRHAKTNVPGTLKSLRSEICPSTFQIPSFSTLDVAFRRLYFVTFVIFNIFYWVYYYQKRSINDDHHQ